MISLSDLRIKQESIILSNQAKIIHFKRKGSPLAVKISFIAGSKHDKIPGTAHFLEHILLAGTKKYPTKDKLAEAIEIYGGNFKATTGQEFISINFAIGNPKDIKIISSLLGEMLFNPLLNDNIIDNERNSIYREIEDKLSNPIKNNIETFQKQIFKGSPLQNSILGTKNSIAQIFNKDLQAFYRKNILSGKFIFVTSGDISIKEIDKQFSPILSKIKTKKIALNKPTLNTPSEQILLTKYQNNNQTYFTYGFKTPQVSENDMPVLNVLSQLLGSSRSSILIRKLRYEKGLISGLNLWNRQLTGSGFWAIQTSTDKTTFKETLYIIQETLKEIAKKSITDKELDLIKNKIINSSLLALQTSESIVNFHGHKQTSNKSPTWTVENYLQEIHDVEIKDIKRVASKYFQKAYLSILGNVEVKDIKLL